MDVHCGCRLKRPFVGGGKLLGKQPKLFLSPLKLPLSPHSGKRAGTALCWCCCFCLSTTRDFHVFRDINLAQTNDNRLNPWLCNGLNVLWSLSPWQLQARSKKLQPSLAIVYMYKIYMLPLFKLTSNAPSTYASRDIWENPRLFPSDYRPYSRTALGKECLPTGLLDYEKRATSEY